MSPRKQYRSLRAYLEATDTTQEQFARVLGISPSHLSQILSGVKRPSIGLAIQIEAITGISPRDLVETHA